MRIYEGSPRQDFEEVFRSIGAFLDQRGMKDVLLLEAPDGFIVQGLVLSGASSGTWSDTTPPAAAASASPLSSRSNGSPKCSPRANFTTQDGSRAPLSNK